MKTCCVEGCEQPGAFKTRTRPTWCPGHLRELYLQAGLTLLEDFMKPTDYALTRCTKCKFEAHYRFEYVLDRLQAKEPVCRACYWREWAKSARSKSGRGEHAVDISVVRQNAEDHHFTYLGPLTNPSLEGDPHATCCDFCERIEAQRDSDISFGCSCNRNARFALAGTRKGRVARLLKNSDNKNVRYWDHSRNSEDLWETATIDFTQEARWICSEGHSFKASIYEVMKGFVYCPNCRKLLRADRDDEMASFEDERRIDQKSSTNHVKTCAVASRLKPEISDQWHPTKNTKLQLDTISPRSERMVWWQDSVCGHEFQATPSERYRRECWRCPICHTILDSLAYHYPELVEGWSPENSLSPWKIRPNASKLKEVPLWICEKDPSHVWRAMPADRVNGGQCPECTKAARSRIESEYYVAALDQWGNAKLNFCAYSQKFQNFASCTIDICVKLQSRVKLAIEYDGSYWHRDKVEKDKSKSLDLLEAGFILVRIREQPLPSLQISHPNYHELITYSEIQDPVRDIARIDDWLSHL